MKTEFQDLSETQKRITIEIPSDVVDQEIDRVTKDMERDYFLSAEEAKDYGIVDSIVAQRGAGVAAAA